jgi:hypothetical protein
MQSRSAQGPIGHTHYPPNTDAVPRNKGKREKGKSDLQENALRLSGGEVALNC